MTDYLGIAKYPTTLELPDANSPFNSSVVNPPIEGNRDAIVAFRTYAALSENFTQALYPYPAPGTYANADVFRFQNKIWLEGSLAEIKLAISRDYAWTIDSPGEFSYDAWWSDLSQNEETTPALARWKQKHNAITPPNARLLSWRARLQDESILKTVTIAVDPSDDARGGLPANMPQFSVYKLTAGGAATLLKTQVDPSANLAAYQLFHTIIADITTAPLADRTFASQDLLLIQFAGETGVNALTSPTYANTGGIIVRAPSIIFSRTRIGEP